MKVSSRKAQAILELSVFSALFFVVLGILLNIGQTINHQVDTEVDAYRLALRASQNASNPYSYTIIRDKKLGGVSPRFKEQSRATFSAGASVLWTQFKSNPEIESFSMYQVNQDPPVQLNDAAYGRVFPQLKDNKDNDGDGDTDEADELMLYPTVFDIKTTANTDTDARKTIIEGSARRIEKDRAQIKQNVVRELDTRYYSREYGIDEQGPKILFDQTNTAEVIPGIAEYFPGGDRGMEISLPDTIQPGRGRTMEIYRTGASGVIYRRERETVK